MKKNFQKILVFAAIWFAMPLAFATAITPTPTPAPAVEKHQQMMQEAATAIRETENALKLLNEGKKKETLAALERATGKLELILAREPTLALAPSSVSTSFFDLQNDLETVKKVRREAEKAVVEGRLQDARRILRPFASEQVTSVTNIPLATYPAAIKNAAKLIDENKIENAKSVLQTALSTLVVKNTIVPLPVDQSVKLLKDAESLAEKKNRTEEENKKLASLLKEVGDKLEYAQALGYGTKKDFKNLYELLDTIRDQTKEGRYGSGFFNKIKTSIAELLKPDEIETAPSTKK